MAASIVTDNHHIRAANAVRANNSEGLRRLNWL
jgi:hypothetical protein